MLILFEIFLMPFVAIGYGVRGIAAYMRTSLMARRLGIRDKGAFEPESTDYLGLSMTIKVCPVCHTPARIGINKRTKQRMWWCWKCEERQSLTMPGAVSASSDDDDFLEENGIRW